MNFYIHYYTHLYYTHTFTFFIPHILLYTYVLYFSTLSVRPPLSLCLYTSTRRAANGHISLLCNDRSRSVTRYIRVRRYTTCTYLILSLSLSDRRTGPGRGDHDDGVSITIKYYHQIRRNIIVTPSLSYRLRN